MPFVRRLVAEGLVQAALVVKVYVVGQTGFHAENILERVQIQPLVLEAAPKALNEDVVEGPPPAIHADGDIARLQGGNEGIRGELAALIGAGRYPASRAL